MTADNYGQRSLHAGNSKQKPDQTVKETVAPADGVFRAETQMCIQRGCICRNSHERTSPPFNLSRIRVSCSSSLFLKYEETLNLNKQHQDL